MNESEEQREPYIMMTAGPVNITDSVKDAMIYSEMGHREPEFSNIYAQIRKNLLASFGVSDRHYCPIVVNGSGTSALETVISSIVHNGKKILVVDNGAFGERISEISQTYNIPTITTGH